MGNFSLILMFVFSMYVSYSGSPEYTCIKDVFDYLGRKLICLYRNDLWVSVAWGWCVGWSAVVGL